MYKSRKIWGFSRKIAVICRFFGIFAVLMVFLGCGRAKKGPNVILITLDTTRADRLGCYGYTSALTPTLDKMAAHGVLFESAFTCVPLTLPAHASILTGLLPPEHGIRVNGQNSLSPTVHTVAEKLADKGYQTGAFIASYVLNARYGLDQGFSVYDDDWIGDGGSGIRRQRDGAEVVDSAIQWLEKCNDNPWFCWVHLFDPHTPYKPHKKMFGTRFLRKPYDGEIAYVDYQISRLIAFVQKSDPERETWIIAVGDHGEGLGDHDELEHGTLVYNSTLHVPLIIYRVGASLSLPPVQTPVSHVDIYPTILNICDGKQEQRIASVDLSPALKGKPVENHILYGETDNPLLTYGWCPLRLLIDLEWKYIRGTDNELYHYVQDVQEIDNQADQMPKRVDDMEYALADLESRMLLIEPAEAKMTEMDRQVLASLGYSAGSGSSDLVPDLASLPNPRTMMPILRDVSRSYRLLRRGKKEKAVSILQHAVDLDPDNLSFRFDLAKALYRSDRMDAAAKVLEKAVRHPPVWVDSDLLIRTLTLYAAILSRKGEVPAAISACRAAVEMDKHSIKALNSLAWLLAIHDLGRERAEEAVRVSQQAMDLGGRYDVSNLDTHAAALAAAGQYKKAVATATQAIKLAHQGRNPRQIKELEARRKLYEQDKPYRE